MSEYQRIAFRACDGPVSEENLRYMRRQSSRAEITPWSFDNEYQYGDFRGNAVEMLRRGYDLHVHYANFGIRKLLIRLPHGLPEVKAAKPYLGEESLQFLQDKQGPGKQGSAKNGSRSSLHARTFSDCGRVPGVSSAAVLS